MIPLPTADSVVNAAAAQLGVVESPPFSNRTPYGAWYGLDGNPWCAMFVSWVFAHQGLPLAASTAKGFAYTPAGAAWFQRMGRWSHTPQRGHVVFYDFPNDGVNRISHVGIVESVNANGSIVAIEGNTSPGSGGSQRDGGGVYRRTRSVGIVGYGVPAYDATPPPPPPPPPAHAHETPLVKFATGGPDAKRVHGAVQRPTGQWVWQTNYTMVFWEVQDVQQHMKDQGHNIVVDGIGGPDTRNQLLAYQRARGLAADAVVGPATWSHLH